MCFQRETVILQAVIYKSENLGMVGGGGGGEMFYDHDSLINWEV